VVTTCPVHAQAAANRTRGGSRTWASTKRPPPPTDRERAARVRGPLTCRLMRRPQPAAPGAEAGMDSLPDTGSLVTAYTYVEYSF